MKDKKIVVLFTFLLCWACNQNQVKNGTSKEIKNDTIKSKQIVGSSDTVKVGYAPETTNIETAKKIRKFLFDKHKKDISKGLLTENERKFSFYAVDLNEDAKNEYFIKLNFCGTGGCSFYLLNNDFTVNTYFTVTEPPIFRTSTITNGWHDLILFGDYNQENGVENYIHLKYSATKGKYPSNPSLLKKSKIAPNGHDFVMWHDNFSMAKTFIF